MSENESAGKSGLKSGAVESEGRREALIKIGKYAAYVPPVLVTIGTARGLPVSGATPSPAPAPPPAP